MPMSLLCLGYEISHPMKEFLQLIFMVPSCGPGEVVFNRSLTFGKACVFLLRACGSKAMCWVYGLFLFSRVQRLVSAVNALVAASICAPACCFDAGPVAWVKYAGFHSFSLRLILVLLHSETRFWRLKVVVIYPAPLAFWGRPGSDGCSLAKISSSVWCPLLILSC